MLICRLALIYFTLWFLHSYSLKQPKEKNIKELAGHPKELVFQHVPYNFGHTIEKVAAFGNGMFANFLFGSTFMFNAMANRIPVQRNRKDSIFQMDEEIRTVPWMGYTGGYQGYKVMKSKAAKTNVGNDNGLGYQAWGALSRPLMQKSSKGCPMYLTPTKFWPPELAETYFGNRSIFGMIRDPLERLVALFRGSVGGETGDIYGGSYDKWAGSCDVDGAVNAMMKNYIKNRFSDPYSHGCTFLPQTDYIGGKFGINIPVDNRRFPMSINNLWSKFGYSFQITNPDILHVTGCEETWAGAVQRETRNLVKMVYKQDYSYICEAFGYCEEYESTCLKHVPKMCPKNMSLAPAPLIELPYGFGIYLPEGGLFAPLFPHPIEKTPSAPPTESSNDWNPDIANPWAEALRLKSFNGQHGAANFWPANPWATPWYASYPEYEEPPSWFTKPMNNMVAKAMKSEDPNALYDFSRAFATKPWAAVPWDEGTLADVEAAREAGIYSWGPGSLT